MARGGRVARVKSWLYDTVVDLDVIDGDYDGDGEWGRSFLGSRLFAVDPSDAAAMAGTYGSSDALPPLPFSSCWFEPTSDNGRESLFGIVTESGRERECLALHIVENPDDDIWTVLIILRDTDQTFDVLSVLVVAGQTLTMEGNATDSNIWEAACILAELSTAQGVYHEDQPAYRQLRRRYERRGLTAPPRAILHIGRPRSGPSVPRGE